MSIETGERQAGMNMDTSSCTVHPWGKRLGGSKDASFAAKSPEVCEVTMVS